MCRLVLAIRVENSCRACQAENSSILTKPQNLTEGFAVSESTGNEQPFPSTFRRPLAYPGGYGAFGGDLLAGC